MIKRKSGKAVGIKKLARRMKNHFEEKYSHSVLRDAARVIDQTFSDLLLQKKAISIKNFGTFSCYLQPAGIAIDSPHPARQVLRFRPHPVFSNFFRWVSQWHRVKRKFPWQKP